jgi:hypothetical protein
MNRTLTQTLSLQLISFVILLGSAAAFGLGRAPRPAAVETETRLLQVALVTHGASCGLDEEPPVPAPRPRFGAARCTE